jgi:hypothetical protein
MKKFLLILILLPLFAQSPELDDLKTRVWNFEKHYDIFVRKLYGCPLTGPATKDNCLYKNSTVDYAAFTKAQAAAKKLFP